MIAPDTKPGSVARFAIPAGVLVGVGVVASYLFALDGLELSVLQARTVATTVLVAAVAGAAISIGALRLSGFPEQTPDAARRS